ncbi:hypothetical protein SS50377_22247 [Spironucleus salmonicida]|uniref:SHIPPO 1-like protein n=1 Tax=Spironucleus salmonicida TaxID=348837 RepID=V6LF05_9EUKA|nr:hypothetical protein SS50377_22247 [Spironucleus salmonicida]|eukprot:EST42261.1 hypothetical protein SS50377_18561 [Spironucleus salmonicida]
MSATDVIIADILVPSPAQYTPNSTFTKNHAPDFSISSRHAILRSYQNQICPGSYNPTHMITDKQSPSFSHRGRTSTYNYVPEYKNQIPGPGAHTAFPAHGRALNTAPSYSFSGKYTIKQEQTPGPNKYDPKQIYRDSESFSMRGKHGDLYNGASTTGIIAAGDYNPNKQVISQQNPQFSIRGKFYIKEEHCSPGPQKYSSQQSSIKKNGGSTMSARYNRGWRIF